MSIDPTDRLIQSMAEVAKPASSKLPVVCDTPEPIIPRHQTEEDLMGPYDRNLLNMLARYETWRFKEFRQVKRAVEIGQKMHPEMHWNFYHLDPIKLLPNRPLWIVAAAPTGMPRFESYTLCV